MCHYNHSLSMDAIIMVSKNCPITGEHVGVIFVTQLLVFSVTPFKIDQTKKSKPFHRLSLETGNKKKVDMQRLSPRFKSQQFFLWEICGEAFSPDL